MPRRVLAGRVVAFVGIVTLLACQPSTPSAGSRGVSDDTLPAASQSTPKRVTAVVMGDPPHFAGRFNASTGSVPGLDALEEMLNAGMANYTSEGNLRPQLAEAVPSLENGLWKLLPDGRIELTWRFDRRWSGTTGCRSRRTICSSRFERATTGRSPASSTRSTR